jgi:NhaP-type Na+/H+ or K+/H+ antiporter
MGVSTTAVSLAYVTQHFLGGREFSVKQWVGITAVLGLLFGLGSGLLTLLFMVVKTGLHAHGPEFTPPEVTWIIQQTVWWMVVGLLAGLGLGMITGKTRDEG